MAAAGIYGIAFSPYVGPWVGGAPVLFNTYTLDQVTQLLTPVAKAFSLITTYGQGTFVWQTVPKIQDSNRLNIQAAKNVGLKVSAGCYQQGANPGNDSINVEWTKTEIDYALGQAKHMATQWNSLSAMNVYGGRTRLKPSPSSSTTQSRSVRRISMHPLCPSQPAKNGMYWEELTTQHQGMPRCDKRCSNCYPHVRGSYMPICMLISIPTSPVRSGGIQRKPHSPRR